MILTAALAALPILAIGVFAAQARTDDLDTYLYAYYAKRMLAGQRLYADLWDNKPPGIFWSDAIGLFLSAGRYSGIVIMCSLAAVGSCLAFFLTARKLYNLPVAAVALVMAALYLFLYDYHVGSNRPNTFYVFFELCVMALYVHSFAGRRGLLFFAGMCAAAAVGFRQTAFSSAAAIAVHQVFLLLTKRQTRATLLSNGAIFLAGCLTVTLVTLGLLSWTSDLSFAWHGVVTSNLGYFSRPGKSKLLPELYRWHDHLKVLGLPLILASAAVIYAVANALFNGGRGIEPSRNAEETRTVTRPPAIFALLVTWFPIALYLALLGPSKRMMYFGVALGPLLLLATHGVWLLMRPDEAVTTASGPRFRVIVAVLWFAFMMLPAMTHQVDSLKIAYFRRFDDRSVPRHRFIVDLLRRYTRPDDPIYMWGYLPAVYWYADRPLAERYIVTTLIDQWLGAAQPYVDTVIADIKRQPPKAIVMDRKELKTIEQPPHDHQLHYGDFGNWLRTHYSVPSDCPAGNVWIRKDPGAARGSVTLSAGSIGLIRAATFMSGASSPPACCAPHECGGSGAKSALRHCRWGGVPYPPILSWTRPQDQVRYAVADLHD